LNQHICIANTNNSTYVRCKPAYKHIAVTNKIIKITHKDFKTTSPDTGI